MNKLWLTLLLLLQIAPVSALQFESNTGKFYKVKEYNPSQDLFISNNYSTRLINCDRWSCEKEIIFLVSIQYPNSNYSHQGKKVTGDLFKVKLICYTDSKGNGCGNKTVNVPNPIGKTPKTQTFRPNSQIVEKNMILSSGGMVSGRSLFNLSPQFLKMASSFYVDLEN